MRGSLRREIGIAARFGGVGIVATALHLAVANITLATGLLSPGGAHLAGFLLAFAFATIGHHRVSFRSTAPLRRSALRYGAVAVAGFLASGGLLAGVLALTPVSEAQAVTLAALSIPAFSYLASRLWG